MLIMIIYKETHENITLFHYSDFYHIYLKTHGKYYSQKQYWRSLFKKSPKENIIYKEIHSKNYEKLNKLLFKAHEN